MSNNVQNNNVSIGPTDIGALASENEEDNPDEYIGFLTFSTTGEVLVPRPWLIQQWEEHGLDQSLLPRKPTKWMSYRRTVNGKLKDENDIRTYQARDEEYGETLNWRLDIDKSGDEGSNVFIVTANKFIPERLCGKEGGDWDNERIGHFDFWRSEDGESEGMIHESEIEKDSVHYNHLANLFEKAREIMKIMQDHHIFNDINSILETYRSHVQAVEIRRSVYFVGAHEEQTINSLSSIWRSMNQFKEDGEKVRIDKTPVVNMSDQRELIAEKVRDKVQSIIDDIVGKIISEFEESDDETADEAANKLMSQLEESKDISSTYNQLLDMKLSIKEVLEEERKELSDEADEVVENVLNQQTFDDV